MIINAISTSKDTLLASEALFGFMGWLTSRKQSETFSSNHDAARAVDLVSEFMNVNNLAEPRDDWTKNFTMPRS